MFNSVEYIRDLCKLRNIPICQLEKSCGFSNGYLNPKKLNKLPYDRALLIAEILDVSIESLYGENIEEQKEIPAAQEGNRDDPVTMELMDIIQNGTDEDRQDLLEMYRMLKRREKR